MFCTHAKSSSCNRAALPVSTSRRRRRRNHARYLLCRRFPYIIAPVLRTCTTPPPGFPKSRRWTGARFCFWHLLFARNRLPKLRARPAGPAYTKSLHPQSPLTTRLQTSHPHQPPPVRLSLATLQRAALYLHCTACTADFISRCSRTRTALHPSPSGRRHRPSSGTYQLGALLLLVNVASYHHPFPSLHPSLSAAATGSLQAQGKESFVALFYLVSRAAATFSASTSFFLLSVRRPVDDNEEEDRQAAISSDLRSTCTQRTQATQSSKRPDTSKRERRKKRERRRSFPPRRA